MQHDAQKERQEASLIGKILSMELLIFLMGCMSLWYGFTEGKSISIFWGVIILAGFVILKLVKKKDWAKHFAEMEAEQKARQAYRERTTTGTPEDKP